MKKIVGFFVILVNIVSYALPLTDIPSAKIDYKAISNESSVHYLEPIVLQLKNLSSQKIIIDITVGMLFIPEDSAYQTIITTAPLTATLLPNATMAINLKGMCIEKDNASGKSGLLYKASSSQDKDLLQLCSFIALHSYQNAEAQQALWTLIEDQSLDNVWGADTICSKALIKELAYITGKPIPKPDTAYIRNYYYQEPLKVEIGGMYEWEISHTRSIIIGMFAPNGTLVREIYKNMNEAAGKKKIEFHFDPTVYDEPYYDFKLIFDNRSIKNQRLYVKK